MVRTASPKTHKMVCGTLRTIDSSDHLLAGNIPVVGVPVLAQSLPLRADAARSIRRETLGTEPGDIVGAGGPPSRALPSAGRWRCNCVESRLWTAGADPWLTDRWPHEQPSVGRGVASGAYTERPK